MPRMPRAAPAVVDQVRGAAAPRRLRRRLPPNGATRFAADTVGGLAAGIAIASRIDRGSQQDKSRGCWGDAEMLEYLGYALFVMLMIACLGYVMRSLESEETSPDQKQ